MFRKTAAMTQDKSPDAFNELPLPGFLRPERKPVARGKEDFRKDHRKRLRERFLLGGANAMPDYELLELVLFRAIPRMDVKPLAKRLLAASGDAPAETHPQEDSEP